MKLSALTLPIIAAAFVAGGAGAASAQSAVNPSYSAPLQTGSAGNSNTGPGAQRGGHTGVLGGSASRRDPASTGSTRPAPGSIDSMVPAPTGSAGNSNTGPGRRTY
jgi:hypothetical protein